MLDPHFAPIHSEYRRHALLQEAAQLRLVALARRGAVEASDEAPASPSMTWRPALFRFGVWLVQVGQRLQAAASPRVLAA